MSSPATRSAPTPAGTPWGRPRTAHAAAPALSLAEIQREQQVDEDAALARRMAELERREEEQLAAALAASMQPDNHDEDKDEEDDAAAGAAAAPAAAAPSADGDADADMAIAQALQAEFDREHDQELAARERLMNKNNSKVTVSMDLHRTVFSAPERQRWSAADEAALDSGDESEGEEVGTYHKGTRTFRDRDGVIITKHNAKASGRQNRKKMESLFPVGFKSGDMAGGPDFRLSNRVYNSLRKFADREERQQQRLHEKKEKSTSDMALDQKTRLILYKLVNGGVLDEINGSISSGKESVVFHGTSPLDSSDPSAGSEEVAIKVFKTTLTEFKNRQQFLHGDRRFEARVGRQSARKLVKLWAEKEYANLTRMARAGLHCPQVILQRKHVLVMSFVGRDGRPAPKLKDLDMSPADWRQCLDDLLADMHTLYNTCRLVHADLSEYNILYAQHKPHIIDVGQAVEPEHPRAKEYLYRDCANVHRFFDKVGCPDLPSAADIFRSVCGLDITPEEQKEYLVSLRGSRAAPKESLTWREEPFDTSAVCVRDLPRPSFEQDEESGDDDDDDSTSSDDMDMGEWVQVQRPGLGQESHSEQELHSEQQPDAASGLGDGAEEAGPATTPPH